MEFCDVDTLFITTHKWEHLVEHFAAADVPLGERRMVGLVPFNETAGDKSGAVLAFVDQVVGKKGEWRVQYDSRILLSIFCPDSDPDLEWYRRITTLYMGKAQMEHHKNNTLCIKANL